MSSLTAIRRVLVAIRHVPVMIRVLVAIRHVPVMIRVLAAVRHVPVMIWRALRRRSGCWRLELCVEFEANASLGLAVGFRLLADVPALCVWSHPCGAFCARLWVAVKLVRSDATALVESAEHVCWRASDASEASGESGAS